MGNGGSGPIPLLKVSALAAGYGHAQVLFDISFEIHPGEVITLLGRNGMGRSTIVKCLFGMLRPNAGHISIAGAQVNGFASHRIARQGLALVPEGRQIFSELTVEENLVATGRVASAIHALDNWTLDRVYGLFPRLRERRRNLGGQLSGGEQQMLAIGRALMTNPRLLVLDEATEGLAPVIRDEIWQTLAKLKREGLAQVVIDKHLGRLLQLADRHYIIEKGYVTWRGDSHSLRAHPDLMRQSLGI